MSSTSSSVAGGSGSTSETSSALSGPKGPMIGAGGADFSASGLGAPLGVQLANGQAATEMALSGADVSSGIKQNVLHDLSQRVGALSHEDLLGARSAALQTEAAQQLAQIMDEAAKIGLPAPPMLKASDLSAWRAERQATASQEIGAQAGVSSSPYHDRFAIPTFKMP